jgi:hypothetical protein
MPISTFPRHDYDEDEYLLKPAGLRDTHSEGKVNRQLQLPLARIGKELSSPHLRVLLFWP